MRKRQGFLAGTSELQVVLFVFKERISICLVEVYGESVGSFDISDSFFHFSFRQSPFSANIVIQLVSLF